MTIEAARLVQFGCGFTAPTTWTNFDSSPTLRFERLPILGRLYTKNSQRFPENVRYGDIVRGLPVPNGTCAAVFGSHVLEHLTREDFDRGIANVLTMLSPGGVFRAVLPDLEAHAREYLANPSSDANDGFMDDTRLGVRARPRGLAARAVALFGSSGHLWMWDARSLQAALTRAGFRSVRTATFGDSSVREFEHVERADRFERSVAVKAVA